MTNQYEGWQKLCEEYDAAKEADFKAYVSVTKKFSQIAQGGSGTNPANDELDEWDALGDKLEDVKRRMKEFIKANT